MSEELLIFPDRTSHNYSCNICFSEFPSNIYLQIHSITHVIEEPLNCKLCLVGFKRILNLDKHFRTHKFGKKFSKDVLQRDASENVSFDIHPISDNKRSPTSVCSHNKAKNVKLNKKSAATSYKLSYMCDVCKAVFADKLTLDKHFHIHQKEKDFVSSFCEEEIADKELLDKHPEIHQEVVFLCGMCQEEFSNEAALDKHLENHKSKIQPINNNRRPRTPSFSQNKAKLNKKPTAAVSHMCDACEAVFADKLALDNHFQMHKKEENFVSSFLEVEIADEVCLDKHPQTQEEIIFLCSICQETFSSEAGLDKHLEIHNSNSHLINNNERSLTSSFSHNKVKNKKSASAAYEISYMCDVCEAVFSDKLELDTHFQTHNNKNIFVSSVYKEEIVENKHRQTHEETVFVCGICGDEFSNEAVLDKHLEIHNSTASFVCGICQKEFPDKVELDRHFQTHSIKPVFACGVCKERFTDKSTLDRHFKTHNEKSFDCPVCRKKFSGNLTFIQHLKNHKILIPCNYSVNTATLEKHEKSCNAQSEEIRRELILKECVIQYICNKCPKKFKQALSFQQHMESEHLEDGYLCDFCKKIFTRKSLLSRHVSHTHRGKNYSCDVFQKKVTQYVCNKCPKKFKRLLPFQQHLESEHFENGYLCDFCKKKFTRKSLLNRHVSRTHGGKKYSCDMCQKNLSSKSNLLKHIYTHATIKCFACNTCNETFDDTIALDTHRLTHENF